MASQNALNNQVTDNDFTVTRQSSLAEVVVTQTAGTDFARFRALGTAPKTGFFSSGISTPLYWNFGMASTLGNAYVLNTSPASVAPEGGTRVLVMTQAGEQTMPLQPAFLSFLPASDLNVTGAGGIYLLGTTGGLLTISTQQGTGLTTAGVFTAPVFGFYHFTAAVNISGITVLMNNMDILFLINGASNIYGLNQNPGTAFNAGGAFVGNISCSIFLAAGATVQVAVSLSGGAGNTVDIVGAAVATATVFSGCLLC